MNTKSKDLDPKRLVERLLDKSRSGTLKWEPTADTKTYVASIGGEATFRIRLVAAKHRGRTITDQVPRLEILDPEGRLQGEITDVEGGALSRLYELAKSIGDRPEERSTTSRVRRRPSPRMDGRDAFLRKLRRYPADRSLSRFGEGRKARDFWSLVQIVLDRR